MPGGSHSVTPVGTAAQAGLSDSSSSSNSCGGGLKKKERPRIEAALGPKTPMATVTRAQKQLALTPASNNEGDEGFAAEAKAAVPVPAEETGP
ncbi:hypothetical protein H920_17102 [Fukomys damarensis]|uniref:Uncharacterized protein n=1 Tax=Fukomys damarensis TaxID=885580 RepID=A0A091DF78_FUKDA|nr:hypothetical protein H920_17102 [Fukomys damarensis]